MTFRAGGRSHLGPVGSYKDLAQQAPAEQVVIAPGGPRLRAHASRGHYALPTKEEYLRSGGKEDYEAYLKREQSPVVVKTPEVIVGKPIDESAALSEPVLGESTKFRTGIR